MEGTTPGQTTGHCSCSSKINNYDTPITADKKRLRIDGTNYVCTASSSTQQIEPVRMATPSRQDLKNGNDENKTIKIRVLLLSINRMLLRQLNRLMILNLNKIEHWRE
jgi:hypothetical protein